MLKREGLSRVSFARHQQILACVCTLASGEPLTGDISKGRCLPFSKYRCHSYSSMRYDFVEIYSREVVYHSMNDSNMRCHCRLFTQKSSRPYHSPLELTVPAPSLAHDSQVHAAKSSRGHSFDRPFPLKTSDVLMCRSIIEILN